MTTPFLLALLFQPPAWFVLLQPWWQRTKGTALQGRVSCCAWLVTRKRFCNWWRTLRALCAAGSSEMRVKRFRFCKWRASSYLQDVNPGFPGLGGIGA